jgi:hypothetical protein
MSKLEEAKGILSAIGMPRAQTNDRSAYVLLSLSNLEEDTPWEKATRPEMRIVDMMNFMQTYYGKEYKPNTRETIRKDTIHQFVDAAVAERNTDSADRPTNSPNYCYCLTSEMLKLVQSYGSRKWQAQLKHFISEKGTLMELYRQQRDLVRVPVVVNGQVFNFSAGDHNTLQKAVIEEFAPRFARGAEILYIGDTETKDLVKNREVLGFLGVEITDHDKLPDIILYYAEKEWLFFIEAVTSVGPISVKRKQELEQMTICCKAGRVFVTAFPDNRVFKRFIDQLAWETEVWISDNPDHMIHFNGDMFIGPR